MQSAIIFFVVTVRIMKIVDGRKEISMKEKVVKRLNEEMLAYRRYLVSGVMTAEQLVEEAYGIALRQFIVEAMECLVEENRLSDELCNWLNEKECVLDYLYSLWMDCDISFIPELAEVLYNEVSHDREVHRNE